MLAREKLNCSFNNCIVIGDNLVVTHDYQLLIDSGGVKINRIMSQDEYNLIHNIVSAIQGINEVTNRDVNSSSCDG